MIAKRTWLVPDFVIVRIQEINAVFNIDNGVFKITPITIAITAVAKNGEITNGIIDWNDSGKLNVFLHHLTV